MDNYYIYIYLNPEKSDKSEGLIRDRVIGKTKRYSKLKEYKIKYK